VQGQAQGIVGREQAVFVHLFVQGPRLVPREGRKPDR
jgi:hypothetical protein